MCTDCKARRKLARDALYRAKVGEAVGHAATGVAEMLGLKAKSGKAELQEPTGHLKQPKTNPAQPVNQRP